MLSLGAFAFAAPGMLALLVALPVIYFLLRLIPPLPKLVRFPAIRLLIGLEPPRADADEDAVVAAAAAAPAGDGADPGGSRARSSIRRPNCRAAGRCCW
jgi:hypothetical protein